MRYVVYILRILTVRLFRKELEELIELRKERRVYEHMKKRDEMRGQEIKDLWDKIVKLQNLCNTMRYTFRKMKGRDVRSRLINWPNIP
jgi:hypothetical protein